MNGAGREAWRTIFELLFEGETHDRIHAICESFGLTPGLSKALIHLSEDRGVAMREMAHRWGCDASYVTTVVDGLEQRGIAVRQPSPVDRRVKAVALTPAGTALKAQILERLFEPPKAFDVLSEAEQVHLRDLLAKVAGADERLVRYRARAGNTIETMAG